MRELICGSVRIQFLTEELIRLEEILEGEFCDRSTFFIPDRNALCRQARSCEAKQEGKSIWYGELELILPEPEKGLEGLKVCRDGECVYTYEKIPNTGELPFPGETPYLFPLMDTPRILMPENGYGYGKEQTQPHVIQEKAVDLYLLICRGDHRRLRQLYVELTGRPELVRLSTLGSWNSRYYAYHQEEAEQMILDYEKHDVPLDNIVIDTDWRKASDRGIGYEIDTELFPDMKAWFAFAHEHHVEVMFNDHPEPAEGADHVLSPEEMAYRDENLTELLEMGLDTWWYDRNWSTKLKTPTDSVAAETWGMYAFSEITRHHYQKASATDEYRRPVIMGNVNNIVNGIYRRINDSASHRYSIQWTGDIGTDLNALQEAVVDCLRAGNHAVPYVHPDAGGHLGTPTKEMFIRWMQMCSFLPVFRPHCTSHVLRYREPWAYDEETLNIVREYIKMRYRLLPVFYRSAFESWQDGAPVCRALPWEYPDDRQAAAYPYEFMVGDILLSLNNTERLYSGKAAEQYYAEPVKAVYYAGTELKGEPLAQKEYSSVQMYLEHTAPEENVPVYDFSASFETVLRVNEDMELWAESDDGIRVFVDGEKRLENWTYHSAMMDCVGRIAAGKHKVRLEYFQGSGEACAALHFKEIPKEAAVDIYLPEGQWMYLWDGEIYQGKSVVSRSLLLEEQPMFVRLGSVLVLAENAQTTKEQYWDRLTMDLYPSREQAGAGYVYEDDRETTAYQKGKFRKVPYHMAYDGGQNAFVLNISAAEGSFEGEYACQKRRLRIRYHELQENIVEKILVNGEEADFCRIPKIAKGRILATEGAAPDSNVITFEAEHSLSECMQIEFMLRENP